jgi:pre-rRNA-processing protein TSR4
MRDLSLNAKPSTNKSTHKQTTKASEETNTSQYKSYYIDVDNEPAKELKLTKEKQLLKNYEKEEATASGERWGKEKYEDNSPDKIFEKFQKRVGRSPEQVLRYSFEGSPLWISQHIPKSGDLPPCPHCQSPRVFEMQLLPTMITLGLRLNKKSEEKIEFGVVCVFSCRDSCNISEYSRECVFVQAAV